MPHEARVRSHDVMRVSSAKGGDRGLNIERVAEIAGAGVCVLALVLAVRAPLCARRNYRRTHAFVPSARRLWTRHAIAQECVAFGMVGAGMVALPFDPIIRLMLAVGGGVAYFAAMLIERVDLDLHPFSLRCDQSAKAVMRAYGVQPSERDEAG